MRSTLEKILVEARRATFKGRPVRHAEDEEWHFCMLQEKDEGGEALGQTRCRLAPLDNL
jgi:hypothetical protein